LILLQLTIKVDHFFWGGPLAATLEGGGRTFDEITAGRDTVAVG